eukprot:9585747-Alexandrium_andersonii.AAC.1
MLTEVACTGIAMLLNVIEMGAGWPAQARHARTAIVAKEAGNATDIMQYRMLMLLPSLYRLWARMRVRHVRAWAAQWD